MARKRIINDKELLILLDRGLTHAEIANDMGVSRSAVTRAIKRVGATMPVKGVPTDPVRFKEVELAVTTSLKAKLMKLLDATIPNFDWNKMSVGDFGKMVTAVTKLANEERLMRGESTANIGVVKKIYHEMTDDTKEAVEMLSKKLRQEAMAEADEEYAKKLAEGRVH